MQTIILDEAAHRRLSGNRWIGAVEHLLHYVEMRMARVGREIAKEDRVVRNRHRIMLGVQVRLAPDEPVDLVVPVLQKPQQVVKRPVLHHQNHNVLQIVSAGGHKSPFACAPKSTLYSHSDAQPQGVSGVHDLFSMQWSHPVPRSNRRMQARRTSHLIWRAERTGELLTPAPRLAPKKLTA